MIVIAGKTTVKEAVRAEVCLKGKFGLNHDIYIDGKCVTFTDGKAMVLPEVAKLLKSEGFI